MVLNYELLIMNYGKQGDINGMGKYGRLYSR